jgi:hypothetical protein
VALLSLLSGRIYSQSNTGTLRGTVLDSSGSVVPAARITLGNVETGVKFETVANESGEYAFEFLQGGQYRLSAQVQGFKQFNRTGVLIEAAKLVRVDISLETGEIQQSVEVSAQTLQVDTDSSTLNTTVNNALFTELPSSSRDPRSLVALVPGYASSGSTNGGPSGFDPYYVDGVSASNHVSGGDTNIKPNIDTIQEVRFLTNNDSAEYGATTGAVTIAVMKSGTNSFRGTLFEFWQNNVLNAGDFFAHVAPRLRYNQFGGVVGGPIRKNKTFFFADVLIQDSPLQTVFSNITVPIAAYKAGDFSSLLKSKSVGTDALGNNVLQGAVFNPLSQRSITNAAGQSVWVRDPFPGNIVPTSLFSPAAVKIQQGFLQPQLAQATQNWTGVAPGWNKYKNFDIKIDHHFNESNRLTARYSSQGVDTWSPALDLGSLTGADPGERTQYTGRNSSISYVRVFGARAINNLIVSNGNQYPHRGLAGAGSVSENDLGIYGMPNGAEKTGFPTFTFTNFQAFGSPQTKLWIELQNEDTLNDTFSLTLGKHSVKMGGMFRYYMTNNFQPLGQQGNWTFSANMTNQPGLSSTGFDYASFLLGLPQSFTYTLFPDYFRTRATTYGLFVQDDFRVSRKLTLNVGLRWDLPSWFHEAGNRSGVYSLQAGQYVQFGQSGFRTSVYDQAYANFEPRLGFAYSPFGNSKTVVRGGYGIFYEGSYAMGSSGLLPTSPIFADSDVGRYTSTDNIHWATTLDKIPYSPASKTGTNAASVAVYPGKQPLGYVEQWNFNVQRDLAGTLVQVGYVGSHGLHLRAGSNYSGGYNLNAIPLALAPTAAGRFISPYVPYPQFPAGVIWNALLTTETYNALQVQAQHRLSHGFTFTVAYTHNRQIQLGDVSSGSGTGNPSNYRDPLGNRALDRGPVNAPDRLVASYSYTVPVKKYFGAAFLSQAIGGWEISGITTGQRGAPLTIGTSTNPCACGNSASNAQVNGDPSSGFTQSLSQWFNTSVFSIPKQYTIGNSGRGIVRGPALNTTDVSLARNFVLPWREGMRIQFRGEFYNALNTVNWASPNVTAGSSTFGQITSEVAPRTGQLGLKLYW